MTKARGGRREVLITGGAGFIGVNAAVHFARLGWKVSLFDDLSRNGSRENLTWLRKRIRISFVKADIRSAPAVRGWVSRNPGATLVLHLAAQVAVTRSVEDPIADYEVNALGTLNLLEAVRRFAPRALFLFSSTNKVYGSLRCFPVRKTSSRYIFYGRRTRISETVDTDLDTPYGCSKGAAEQYVGDYHRLYGLKTVIFRQSCVYGPLQSGGEEQGWVTHFLGSARDGKRVTLFGDGRQVRDILYIDDLLEAFERVSRRRLSGRVYNIGGGPRNTLSLLELASWARERSGRELTLKRRPWRLCDQRVYVSDTRKARRDFGWRPTTSWTVGLHRLWEWLAAHR